MNHERHTNIRRLAYELFLKNPYDPAHKLFELAQSFYEADDVWALANPQLTPQNSTQGEVGPLKATPEIAPDDYRWFVYAPGKGWEEIEPKDGALYLTTDPTEGQVGGIDRSKTSFFQNQTPPPLDSRPIEELIDQQMAKVKAMIEHDAFGPSPLSEDERERLEREIYKPEKD